MELPVECFEVIEEIPLLAKYLPNIFAEALIPLNPTRWPTFAAGSFFNSDMPEFTDKLTIPQHNLIVAKEYLETSQSDTQWRDRVWKIAKDTLSISINLQAEIGQDVGAFGAGVTSNKIADDMMDEMYETAVTLTNTEKLNGRIYKQLAVENNVNPNLVRGTEAFRQFVPKSSRHNILNRPVRNTRPLWAQKPFTIPGGRGPLTFMKSIIFNKCSALQ